MGKMMKNNAIVYFSITTEPKVMTFGDKSTSVQFYGQWRPRWANTMNNIEM